LKKERDKKRSDLGVNNFKYEKTDEYGINSLTYLTDEQIDLYAKAEASGALTGKDSEDNITKLRKELGNLSKEDFAEL
jgi:predicted mannosyl-3-phosphoglycerate phosphatase (HAD superfamily)